MRECRIIFTHRGIFDVVMGMSGLAHWKRDECPRVKYRQSRKRRKKMYEFGYIWAECVVTYARHVFVSNALSLTYGSPVTAPSTGARPEHEWILMLQRNAKTTSNAVTMAPRHFFHHRTVRVSWLLFRSSLHHRSIASHPFYIRPFYVRKTSSKNLIRTHLPVAACLPMGVFYSLTAIQSS